MNVRHPQRVEVEWIDIETKHGWRDQQQVAELVKDWEQQKPYRSRGFLLCADRNKVIIAGDLSPTGEVNVISILPRGVVRRIHRDRDTPPAR